MKRRYLISMILLTHISVAGCGSSSSTPSVNALSGGDPFPLHSTPSPTVPSPSGEKENPAPLAERPGLARFASAVELAAFLTEWSVAGNGKNGPDIFSEGPTGEGIPSPTASAGPATPTIATASDGFSSTTLQEVGVDESDLVKNDGTHAFVLKNSEIRIVRLRPIETIQQVASLPIDGFGAALFLHENKLVALSGTGGLFGIPEPRILTEPFEPVALSDPRSEQTIVTLIDVTNRAIPRVERTITLEGNMADSRLIDGTLHVVLREHLQSFSGPVAAEQLSELLPTLADTTSVDAAAPKPLVQPTDVYRPSALTGATSFSPSILTFTTVVSVNLDNPDATIDAIAILTAPGTLYVSHESLYLTDSSCLGCFSIAGSTETTEVHKVVLTAAGPVYVASGIVPGHTLDQFSFSEHEGFLRMATTIRPGPSNNLFVLGETDGLLEIVGSIRNMAPGETIQSARFVGERGFLVTFRQIDPLFTLDLSDPENPIAVGELKVPGFSTFLLPISATELLGLGQDADERGRTTGLQMSIFDVSNFAAPILKHHVTIGEPGTFSEALHNHKALTYFPAESAVAFPVQEFQATTGFTFIGLDVYRADAMTGFERLGRIGTGTIDGFIANPQYTRGVFIEHDVYAITPDLIRAAPLLNITSTPWEAILGAN